MYVTFLFFENSRYLMLKKIQLCSYILCTLVKCEYMSFFKHMTSCGCVEFEFFHVEFKKLHFDDINEYFFVWVIYLVFLKAVTTYNLIL